MQFPPVEEQLAVIKRGVVDLVDEDDLKKRLTASRDEGRPLRIKFGIDPSSPDIHLGHTVPLRKLRDFQRLGHQVIVLWGTATAMVGDPTGRSVLTQDCTSTLPIGSVADDVDAFNHGLVGVVDVGFAS